MEVTRFNPDTGLLEVILVHEDPSVLEIPAKKLEETNTDVILPTSELGILEEDVASKNDVVISEPLDVNSFFEPEIFKVPAIDEDTILENKQDQQDEMECLLSIYGDDYGIVSDDSFVIKLSAGHFVVRFQVTYSDSYPSNAPPEPLILGAYWHSFDHQKVLTDLNALFIEGCTCVYDWTAYVQEYLQGMMDKYAKDLESKDPQTFEEIMNNNRAQLERYLNADDLRDANGWVDSLTYSQRKKLWKLIRRKIGCDTKHVLKQAKKICSNINTMRLYWFCAWLESGLEYHELPSALKHGKKSDVKGVLHLKEISMSSKTLITIENCQILVIGDEDQQANANSWLEIAILKYHLQTLCEVPQNPQGVMFRTELCQSSLAFDHYYKIIKFKEKNLAKVAAMFSTAHLFAIRHDLQLAQRRRIIKQRNATPKFTITATSTYLRSRILNAGSLESYFGKKVQRVSDGHMYVSFGKQKRNRGRGGRSQTVYHGTAARNVKSILRAGLRVNGGLANPANGAAYGRGIYTSPEVSIPFCYAGQQALAASGKKWLCIFECKAFAGRSVSNGIFLVPGDKDISIVGLHLYQTS